MLTRVLCLCLWFLCLLIGARAMTLTFASPVAVPGDVIRLGDVAVIAEAGDATARVSSIVLGLAPGVGRSRTLEQGSIRVRLRQNGLDPNALTLTGPATLHVTRQTVMVAGETITAQARAWLLTQLEPDAEALLASTPVQSLPAQCLPTGALTWECRRLGDELGAVRHVQVTALVDGKTAWHGVLDFILRRADKTPAIASSVPSTTPAAVRPEPAGARVAPLVLRNETVCVRVECGALRITMLAVAAEDGVAGATIRVRNPQTHQEFPARVIGAGELALIL